MSALEQLGFVPIDEIQNIYITTLDKILEDIRVNGVPRNEKVIVDYMDEFRSQLMRRAKLNLLSYLKSNPQVKEEVRQEREAKTVESARMTHQERRAKNLEKYKLVYKDDA